MTDGSNKSNLLRRAVLLLLVGCMAVGVTCCRRKDGEIASKLAQVAELPEFATGLGSSGSVSGRGQYLYEGEFYIVPSGTKHRPVAPEEAHLMMFTAAGNVNTGDVENEFTLDSEKLERI